VAALPKNAHASISKGWSMYAQTAMPIKLVTVERRQTSCQLRGRARLEGRAGVALFMAEWNGCG
jgi:hypothetical protein